jgi:NAD(P)H-dependent FMN reductase
VCGGGGVVCVGGGVIGVFVCDGDLVGVVVVFGVPDFEAVPDVTGEFDEVAAPVVPTTPTWFCPAKLFTGCVALARALAL